MRYSDNRERVSLSPNKGFSVTETFEEYVALYESQRMEYQAEGIGLEKTFEVSRIWGTTTTW